MKHNTNILKKHLLLALQNTPNDFVFENIKPILRSALSIVEKVEKKRDKREQNNISNNLAVQLNDYQLKTIVNNLDNMIKEQEKNIKKIKNPANSQETNPITILID
jgi:vacuolar-type H+-ATPase subunit E/Vma4